MKRPRCQYVQRFHCDNSADIATCQVEPCPSSEPPCPSEWIPRASVISSRALVNEYRDQDFFFDRGFNGIARSDALIVVEITMRRGRSDAMKRALYAAIAQNLEARAAVSPKDVFIFAHENDYSDWSVGNGVFAMALAQQRGTDG
jgi:hypothetical protein